MSAPKYLIETYLNKDYLYKKGFSIDLNNGIKNVSTKETLANQLKTDNVTNPKSMWIMQAQELEDSLTEGDENSPCKGIISNKYLNVDQINKNALMFIVKEAKSKKIMGFAVCHFKTHNAAVENEFWTKGVNDGERQWVQEQQHFLYIDVICSKTSSVSRVLWKMILKFMQDNMVRGQDEPVESGGWLNGIQLSALTYVVGYYYKLGFRFWNIDTSTKRDTLDNDTNRLAKHLQNYRFKRNDDRNVKFLDGGEGAGIIVREFIRQAEKNEHSVHRNFAPPKLRSQGKASAQAATIARRDPGFDGWTMFIKNSKTGGVTFADEKNNDMDILTRPPKMWLTELMKKYQEDEGEQKRKGGGKRTIKKALKKRHQDGSLPSPQECESSRIALAAFEEKAKYIKKALNMKCPIKKQGGRRKPKKRKTKKKKKKMRKKRKAKKTRKKTKKRY